MFFREDSLDASLFHQHKIFATRILANATDVKCDTKARTRCSKGTRLEGPVENMRFFPSLTMASARFCSHVSCIVYSIFPSIKTEFTLPLVIF